MVNGDIKFARIPVRLDSNGDADTSLQDGVTALFPDTVWDIITSQIVDITGANGVSKSVLVVVGRATA